MYLLGNSFTSFSSFEKITIQKNQIRCQPLKPPSTKGYHSLFVYQNEPYSINGLCNIERYDRIADEWQETVIWFQTPVLDPVVFQISANLFRITGYDMEYTRKQQLRWIIKELDLSQGIDNFKIKDVVPQETENNKLKGIRFFEPSYLDLRNEDTNILKFFNYLVTFNDSKMVISKDLQHEANVDIDKVPKLISRESGFAKYLLIALIRSYLVRGTRNFKTFGRHFNV